MKPMLRAWGLRTRMEWFQDRAARVQTPDGAALKLASVGENYLSFELFWRGTGYYEPITTLVAGELARNVDTFVDIGANVGFYSLMLTLRHPALQVIAFEPNPRLHALLQRNVDANGLRRVVCEPVALSDACGEAALYLNQSDMSASLQDDFDDHQTGVIRVRTTTLDDYLDGRPESERLLIKVDVEGHEEAFFRGARRTIAARRPDILTEVAAPYDPAAVAFLEDDGYGFYPITDEGLLRAGALEPVVRGPFVFLNYLLSPRPERELQDLYRRIRDQVRKIDLAQTSKCADSRMLQQLRTRQRALH
jgi:FkbM family methyltransferase